MFVSLLKKRKKDEWLLSSPSDDAVYHGPGDVLIIERIRQIASVAPNQAAVNATRFDERHKQFGYRSADALRSHTIEMTIGIEMLSSLSGSIRLGGQSGRVIVTFWFLGLESLPADPSLADFIKMHIWSDLRHAFDYAASYKRPLMPIPTRVTG
jgi:hypothetical protein